MTTEFEHIIQNIKTCFDGKPWYGVSIMNKLKEIPWNLVNEQKYGAKSIAVLVKHIINWRIFVLKKLEGDEAYDLIIDSIEDWTPLFIKNREEWEVLLEELRRTQSELLEKLALEDEQLLEKRVPGKKYTFGSILTSISQHDIYHLGQISMLVSMHTN
ncbi:DinB family protein [Maribacter litopenaei]|uniref:DinB family protein n=1 Tax=Maribacter litopenaei TaxID=2976127 RepID=A0ABY5YC06_9FLAO|nr:DinB family protein [Maribacter litopenaei]UWX55426.1 DinB family protein [Maribacter litopenaei]